MSRLSWINFGRCVPEPQMVAIEKPDDPASAQAVARARIFCARCQVLDKCRDWAVANQPTSNVWAGMTPAELIAERRRRQRAAAREKAKASDAHPGRSITDAKLQEHANALQALLIALCEGETTWSGSLRDIAAFAARQGLARVPRTYFTPAKRLLVDQGRLEVQQTRGLCPIYRPTKTEAIAS